VTLTRDEVAACDFIVVRCDFDAVCWKPCLFVACCVVTRCDFVVRQSRASKSRDKIAGVTWHLTKEHEIFCDILLYGTTVRKLLYELLQIKNDSSVKISEQI